MPICGSIAGVVPTQALFAQALFTQALFAQAEVRAEFAELVR